MSTAMQVDEQQLPPRFNSELSTINGLPVATLDSVSDGAELPTHIGRPCQCTICEEHFSSKRQLFKHLEVVHNYMDENMKPVKVVCLVGWLSEETSDLEIFIKDSRLDSERLMTTTAGGSALALSQDELSGNGTTKSRVETALFDTIRDCFNTDLPATTEERMKELARSSPAPGVEPGVTQPAITSSRPKSVTRGSQAESTAAVGVERTCHALADTFCFHLLRPIGNEQAWLDSVNARLPSNMRVLSCRVAPGKGSDLNANASCSQRRYEVMLPVDMMLPENDEEYGEMATQFIDGKSFKSLNTQTWANTNKKAGLDDEFPIDTPEGLRRVRFFRIIKAIMKGFGGRYQMFHNFASGGACPDDAYAMRTVDRMYHKTMVTSSTGESWAVFSISGDNFLRGQIRRLFGVAVAIARGWLPDEFLDFAIRFSTVYRDELTKKQRETAKAESLLQAKARAAEEAAQVEKKRSERAARNAANPTTLDIATDGSTHKAEVALENANVDSKVRKNRKDKDANSTDSKGTGKKPAKENTGSADDRNVQDWRNAKSHKCDLNFSCEALCEIPSVPAMGLYLAECKYGNYEAKYEKQGFVLDPRRVRADFRSESDELCEKRIEDWEQVVQQHIMNCPAMRAACKGWAERTKAHCAVIWARAQQLMALTRRTNAELLSACTRIYPSIPEGCLSRAPAAYRNVLRLLQEADVSGAWPASSLARQRVMHEGTLVEQGGTGGTFSVGAFPEGLLQPKGNALFPELMHAAFELERAVFPNRTPSSTIAINKHAQFKPHRDSGAGSGQSRSAIVALGDFIGGELGVEHEVFDIRYKPLEFDGWSQRHYTLPFQGERYSLVWFTPKGCGPHDMTGGKEESGNEAKKARTSEQS